MLAPPLPKPLPLLPQTQRTQRIEQDLRKQMSPRDAFGAFDHGVRDVELRQDTADDGRFTRGGYAVDDECGGTGYIWLET